MQRLTNIDKWVKLAGGSAANFEANGERRMRLDVNAPVETCLWYIDGDGLTTLLAVVKGRDVIEFTTHPGDFAVHADGDVWLYTIDGEDLSFTIPDAHSLTQPYERRNTNPEVQLMQRMMLENTKRIMDAQQLELEKVLHRREQAFEARLAKLAAPAAGGTGVSEPAPAAVQPVGGVSDDADGSSGATGGAAKK